MEREMPSILKNVLTKNKVVGITLQKKNPNFNMSKVLKRNFTKKDI